MSDVIAEVPAAGWYQDPNDDNSMRWWDGDGWTDHTQAIAPAQASQRATGGTSSSAGGDWVSNYTEDELALYTGKPLEQSVASHTGRTVLEFTGTVPDWRRDRTSATTGSVWLLALMPVLVAGIELAWLLVGAGMGLPPMALAAVVPIVALFTILFAVVDARALRARGTAAPSAWWILLGPLVYLIVRAAVVRRSGASGVAPLVVHLIISAAVGAIIALGSVALIASFTSHSADQGPDALQPVIVEQTEQTIQTDLLNKGQNWKVDCSKAAVKITPNSSFQCVGTNGADGSTANIAVVLDAQQRMTYTVIPAK